MNKLFILMLSLFFVITFINCNKDKAANDAKGAKDAVSDKKDNKEKSPDAEKPKNNEETYNQLIKLNDQFNEMSYEPIKAILKIGIEDCTKFGEAVDKFFAEMNPKVAPSLPKMKEMYSKLSKEEKDKFDAYDKEQGETKYKEGTELIQKLGETIKDNPDCKAHLENLIKKLSDWDFKK